MKKKPSSINQKIPIKQISLLFYLFILISFASLLLLNCNKKKPDNNVGFTPNSPTTDNSKGENNYIYNPSSVTRGASSQHSTSGTTSSSVSENEKKWGTSAPLTIVNNLAFTDFRLGRPVNNMKNIENLRVYVKLNKVNKQKYYAGNVTVAYDDYERERPFRNIQFQSGSGANAKYNVWMNTRKKFHGFFQEERGSLILVIDHVTTTLTNPDATTTTNTLYGGSIWTMQFRTTFNGQNSCNNYNQQYVFQYNQNPSSGERIPTLSDRNKKCWFLTNGPFDCRTWRKGKGVNTLKAINPDDNCYRKLATFEGLDILKAFKVTAITQLATH